MSDAGAGWRPVGSGTATSFPDPVEGPLVEVTGPEDVLSVIERVGGEGWEPPIVLIYEAGGTTVGPLFGDIAGVISTKGTLGAHVALLAKEYGCPCLVGAHLEGEAASVGRIRINPDGSIWERDAEEGAGR